MSGFYFFYNLSYEDKIKLLTLILLYTKTLNNHFKEELPVYDRIKDLWSGRDDVADNFVRELAKTCQEFYNKKETYKLYDQFTKLSEIRAEIYNTVNNHYIPF